MITQSPVCNINQLTSSHALKRHCQIQRPEYISSEKGSGAWWPEKGDWKTFTFNLGHVTSDESLPSLHLPVLFLSDNCLSWTPSCWAHKLWLLLCLILVKQGAHSGLVHFRCKLSSKGVLLFCRYAEHGTVLKSQFRHRLHPSHVSVF